MHYIERTLVCILLTTVGNILCQPVQNKNQRFELQNDSIDQTNPESGTNFSPRLNLSVPIPVEKIPKPIGHLNLDTPYVRPPIHSGPGNYLEERRRHTESRIRELENQVKQLLEAQKKGVIIPDPEKESQTAIQYGLNCEQGEIVVICLMKKVVLLRKEVSGIQRDLSELGKTFNFMEFNFQQLLSSLGNGKPNGQAMNETRISEFPLPTFDNSTSPFNGTTENPFDNFPQQDPLCPPKFEQVGNVCYYVVTDRANGVTSASDFCQANGGFLARPRDSLIVHDLANHLTRLHDKGSNQLSELWVDGQYETDKETWRWSDGREIDRSIWGLSNTPSEAQETETCVLLKKELNYLAMPQDCSYHYFFVCQAELIEDTREL